MNVASQPNKLNLLDDGIILKGISQVLIKMVKFSFLFKI